MNIGTDARRFPKYKPNNGGFSIWGESYAGHYAPTIADYFVSQNEKIADGSIDGTAIPLRLDTVGLVNACIDMTTQMPFYPEFAFNNTYGIQRINETVYKAAVDAWPACKAKIDTCRSLEAKNDPDQLGKSDEVNEACADAYKSCFKTMQEPYSPLVVSVLKALGLNRQLITIQNNVFDVASTIPGSFPPKYAAGYFNNKSIQEELGVHVNFTGLSTAASVGE
jgi:carboxypeptidase C (cathepsin A)